MYRGGLLIKHALYNFFWDRPVPFEIDRGILMGLRNGKKFSVFERPYSRDKRSLVCHRLFALLHIHELQECPVRHHVALEIPKPPNILPPHDLSRSDLYDNIEGEKTEEHHHEHPFVHGYAVVGAIHI